MESFENILLFHFEKYPLMTAQDAVKLCYQSSFGCGHLIKNEDFVLSMLKKEMENTEPSYDAQMYEPIGNGYLRLDLHAAKAMGIPAEKICSAFIKSANNAVITELGPKTELLKKLAEEGKTPFSKKELSEYLSGYNGEMVSHSAEYKAVYDPAYRVIAEKFSEDLQ